MENLKTTLLLNTLKLNEKNQEYFETLKTRLFYDTDYDQIIDYHDVLYGYQQMLENTDETQEKTSLEDFVDDEMFCMGSTLIELPYEQLENYFWR